MVKKKKESEPIQTYFVDTKYEMVQQVWDPLKKRTSFLMFLDNEKKFVNKIIHQNLQYIPIRGPELRLGLVLMPSDIEEYGEVRNLVSNIQDHIWKYLDISPYMCQLATWYILLTWVYEKFQTINYLRCLGDTGCGKTRFLNVIGGLCMNATKVSGATTVSAIKRLNQKWHGTILVDEGDFRDSDETNALMKFFNLGYERDSPMVNVDKNHPEKLEFFIPYGPKIIASRKRFIDQALEARCLTEIMKQTERPDIPYVLPQSFYREQLLLRNQLLKFRFDFIRKIDPDADIDFSDIFLEPRLKQATHSFATLFAADREILGEFKQFISRYQEEIIEERASSYDGLLVNTFFRLSSQKYDTITAKSVVTALEDIGVHTNVRTVGRHLKALGFSTVVRKIDGHPTRVILEPKKGGTIIYKRYVPGYNVTKVTKHTYNGNNNINNNNAQKSPKNAIVPLSVYNVTNVTNVTNTPIFLHCRICGNPESSFFSDEGLPICQRCGDQLFPDGIIRILGGVKNE